VIAQAEDAYLALTNHLVHCRIRDTEHFKGREPCSRLAGDLIRAYNL